MEQLHHLHHHHQQQQQAGLAPPPPQYAASDGYPAPAPAPAPAANPTPTHPQPPPSQPSYAEMITAAILWDSSQGKAGGSSKRAIAKYIDRVYTNLPPTHSSLLTHHLRRLKNSGHLVMIKNSYQLPVVASAASAAVPLRSVAPPPSAPETVNSSNPAVKKRPGRPAKPKPLAQQQPTSVLTPTVTAVVAQNSPVGNGSVTGKRPRGRPPRQQPPQQQVQQQQQPVVAEVPFVVQPMYAAAAAPPDNGQSVKRRPGRPPKKEQQFAQSQIQATNHGPVVVPVNGVVEKRSPGRPLKKANVDTAGGGAPAPKPRGRPKRNALGPASKPIGKKIRGRPPKQWGVAPSGGVAGAKRRGRPPKGSVAPPKLVRPPYRGKPRGRPKKNASTLGKQTFEQVAANEELMRKVENMQAAIRDAVFVLRPCMSNENATDALKALQQLEDLSAMNLTATPTSTPVEPPMTVASVGAIAQVEPSTTSVPAPQNVSAPPPATMTIPTMAPPVMPFSIVAPPMTENAPLFAPTIETQQPASWIPSSEAQL